MLLKMKQVVKKIIKKIVEGALFLYCKIVHRVKIEGTENIPIEGAVIFCGNHRSFLDPPLMKVTCKRETHFLAKESLYKNPFLAFLGWVFEVIPVKKDSKDLNAIKSSLKYLKKGESISLYPEGTRNGIAKGEKVKDGAAFFAIRTGAKVVPVGISGKKGAFSKVTIRYGKPLDYSNYKEVDEKEALEAVTQDIMDHILELTK